MRFFRAISSGSAFVLLMLLACTMLVPFLWMISTALMSELEVYQFPPRYMPASLRWSNFTEAMQLQPFGRFFLNTATDGPQ